MGPAYWILTTIVFITLAFLVLTLNYFAHKEYTAEIERLRRDLAATRDKNGVYLAYDNYTKMLMQLEQQEQEISQFLSQIKALKEEMDKKEAICNQLNMSLEDCNTKLATTFNELEVTQQKLTDTSVRLKDQVNECNEKSHLIEKHIETEQALTKQARSLLAVADIATSDTEKLHDKLARKRSVESNNDDVTRDFHVSFVQNVAHMEDSLNRFTQDDIKFCSALQTNLGERQEKRSLELTSLSNEMSSFLESQTELIQDLEKMFSNQVYSDQQWIQQYLTNIRSTSDSEVNNLHKFLTETFLVPVRSMSRQLQLIQAEIQSSSRSITEQIQQRRDAVKTFEASQKDALSQHKENVALHLKQQKQALDVTEEGCRGIDETTSSYKETLKDSVQQMKILADSLLATFGSTENHLNDNKSKMKSGLSVAREKCEHVSAMSSALEQQLKRRAEHFNTCETQTEEILDSVGNSKETMEQLINGAERFVEELEDGVRAHVSNGETSWRNHYSSIEQEMRKYSENLNGELQRELKQTQNLMSGLRESAESHEAILEQQRIDFGTFVRERQDDLENHCSYISSWSQTIVSELQLRNQEVDKFLVEDLRKDLPTGTTPQRREFQYPRQLVATSPHERILNRFREMNDESAFKIPDESFKERQSFKERRGSSTGSSSSEDSGLNVERLNQARAKSLSVSDLSNTSETVLNTSLHSEPSTLKINENKENKSSSLRKYHSEDLKQKQRQTQPKSTPASRKALKSQNY